MIRDGSVRQTTHLQENSKKENLIFLLDNESIRPIDPSEVEATMLSFCTDTSLNRLGYCAFGRAGWIGIALGCG